MSEEPDFNSDLELDSRSYEEPTSSALSNLKTRSRNGCIVSGLLIISPTTLVGLTFLLPLELRDAVFLPLLLGSGILAVMGVVVAGLYGTGLSSLVRAYEILEPLGPPKPQLGQHYVVKEYRDVYIIGHSISGMLYFVAFGDQVGLTSASKMKLPPIHKWKKRIDVNGYRLLRSDGIFSMTTERGDYVSGEGVLYAQELMPNKYNLSVPKFTKDGLLVIIEHVSEDAKESPHEQHFS
jgi:hypothetical protein